MSVSKIIKMRKACVKIKIRYNRNAVLISGITLRIRVLLNRSLKRINCLGNINTFINDNNWIKNTFKRKPKGKIVNRTFRKNTKIKSRSSVFKIIIISKIKIYERDSKSVYLTWGRVQNWGKLIKIPGFEEWYDFIKYDCFSFDVMVIIYLGGRGIKYKWGLFISI